MEPDAWIVGRISMEPYAGKARLPTASRGARIPPADFVARSDASSYAIAIDPGGKLRWESGRGPARSALSLVVGAYLWAGQGEQRERKERRSSQHPKQPARPPEPPRICRLRPFAIAV